MASGPIPSWQIDGEKSGNSNRFYFLGLQITADGDCCHEIKMSAPWKKRYDSPRQRIKKQRHYFVNKVCVVKSMVFPVDMYGCVSWNVKKAEC